MCAAAAAAKKTTLLFFPPADLESFPLLQAGGALFRTVLFLLAFRRHYVTITSHKYFPLNNAEPFKT